MIQGVIPVEHTNMKRMFEKTAYSIADVVEQLRG